MLVREYKSNPKYLDIIKDMMSSDFCTGLDSVHAFCFQYIFHRYILIYNQC